MTKAQQKQHDIQNNKGKSLSILEMKNLVGARKRKKQKKIMSMTSGTTMT
jgi:hypothetical protein